MEITRPIIGIENRSAQEVFDIMCDRIRLSAAPAAVKVRDEAIDALRNHQRQLDADGVMVGVSREALEEALSALEPAPVKASEWLHEKLTPDEAWDLLCNLNDRTSPEEYPDHALITKEELASYMERAVCSPKSVEPHPVAWQYRDADGEWHTMQDASERRSLRAECIQYGHDLVERPLFTATPSPERMREALEADRCGVCGELIHDANVACSNNDGNYHVDCVCDGGDA